MTFFMTLYTYFYSVARHVISINPGKSSNNDENVKEITTDSMPENEHSPSPPTPKFSETELLASVLKRLGELEEKMDTIKAKPSEMPYEKAELLNAAVCRVDALEAELIATKKVKSLIKKFFLDSNITTCFRLHMCGESCSQLYSDVDIYFTVYMRATCSLSYAKLQGMS